MTYTAFTTICALDTFASSFIAFHEAGVDMDLLNLLVGALTWIITFTHLNSRSTN